MVMLKLREGRWEHSVDEKGRFAIPAKIRKAGDKWVWGLNGQEVVLMPQQVWEEKLAAAEDQKKMRLDWHPFEYEPDQQGRVCIPAAIKELGGLGQEIVVLSMGDHLLIQNIPTQEETVLRIAPRPFQSSKEAFEWLSRGDNVAYYSRPDRVIVGKLISGNGIVFTLDGKDKNGILVRLNQIPYCSLYPLKPKREEKKEKKDKSPSDRLLDKFPDFDPDWPDRKKKQWFDDFARLVSVVVQVSG